MTRLANTFEALRSDGRKALVVYLTAGDPTFATSLAAAQCAIDAGADVLEVGVPFSDPVADGPAIQRAMGRALAGGGGLNAAIELVRRIRETSTIPLVVFGYVNPLIWTGTDAACARIAVAGGDGLLIVDVPPEEAAPYRAAVAAHRLDWVSLLAPTTGAQRAQRIARDASGFLYVISMLGVTGGALTDVSAVEPTLRAVREVSDLPACIGFGIRDGQTAAIAARVADGVVVGSAVVRALEEGTATHDGPARVAACVAGLRAGIDAVNAGGALC